MNQHKTKKSQLSRAGKSQYRKYDYKRRLRLIQMVEKQSKSLASSAKQLGIAQTTARLIMKTWREEGRVFEKKIDRVKRQKKEAIKQSQARRKEKQRLRKLARKQISTSQVIQEPMNEIKTEQIQSLIPESERVEIYPQTLLEPTVGYNTWMYYTPFLCVSPQTFYF